MDVSTVLARSTKSTDEETRYNLNFLKQVYTLYFLEMLCSFIWSSFIVGYPDAFSWVGKYWFLGLLALLTTGGCFTFCLLSEESRTPPLNFLTYAIFVLAFSYTSGWVSQVDGSLLFYFSLSTLTSISFGLLVYSVFSSWYMQTMFTLLFVIGFSLATFHSFILLTEISMVGMFVCYVFCVMFGFLLNVDLRKVVRGSIYNKFKDDSFTAAVRLWGEVAAMGKRVFRFVVDGCNMRQEEEDDRVEREE